MKVLFGCLCDYASIDQGGKLSANGIWDRVFAPKFPASLGRTFLAIRVSLEYDDNDKPNKLDVTLVDADGHSLVSQQLILEHARVLPGAFQTHSFVTELSDTVVERPGRYTWVLRADLESPYEVPFDVSDNLKEVPPGAAPGL
ncbi:MAG: hypothetical protein M3068_02940 [Gemmatimonadota bacterium]|nr:hypothetical protein [Gemmatimonadota bacterium]